MNRRHLFALAVPLVLVACSTETTSLGGPRNQSSASSGEDEPAIANHSTPTSSESAEPTVPSIKPKKESDDSCGYSWMPVPASAPCHYVLPTGPLDGSGGRDFKPATWDPQNVYLHPLWLPGWSSDGPAVPGQFNLKGAYKETIDDCGSDHGWYYVSPADGGPVNLAGSAETSDPARPTMYALCPATCDAIESGGDFRFAAYGSCRR